MATTAKDIIAQIEKNYPMSDQAKLKNFSDLNFEIQKKFINQYIIGIVRTDPDVVISGKYQSLMQQKLSSISKNVKCLPWHFDSEELSELKIAITQLGEHFKVRLNINEMMKRQKISKDNVRSVYLVVTVVQYEVAFIAQEIK